MTLSVRESGHEARFLVRLCELDRHSVHKPDGVLA